MESEPIQRGAIRPRGRRHALVPVLVRLVAIAGFLFAGWIALSALAGSAFAAERPPEPAAGLADQGFTGSSTLGHFSIGRDWRAGDPADVLFGDVREIGHQPMRYLRSRQQDVFDDKDRAVRHVREVADAAGVPQVRVPDVRPAGPDLGGLVHRVTGSHPALHDGLPPNAGVRPAAQDDRAQVRQETVSAAVHTRHATAAAPAMTAGDPADRHSGPCPGCHGDHRVPAPGPVLPTGQDGPRGGGSAGGHPFAPLADLLNRRYPAAPPAVHRGTFHRTALTDVAAPGGPSVVPD
ncbi:hypothetical protein ACQPZP_02880 [Spirillospora sp. CA-142024]|uniref:hypothetical protein n=1 Tax=Spirillospora sp. CA-142024 TaxID=3240036 RepID=UPI003D94F4F9